MDIISRHRPTKLEDMYPTVTGLSSIVKLVASTLKGEVDDKGHPVGLNHLMLFVSEPDTFGVGKTTTARLLGTSLNPDLPQEIKDLINTGQENPIYFEIDSAVTGGKDACRDLRDKIEYLRDAITSYKYVFVLDEAHNITTQGQEALLKLEDIPENVYIILNTTNEAKIIPTLRQRMARYLFKPLNNPESKKFLLDILPKEAANVKLKDETISDIIRTSRGCPRGLLRKLKEFLDTGVITDSYGDENEKETEIGEFAKYLVDTAVAYASGDSSKNWSNAIVNKLQGALNIFSADEIRVEVMKKLAGKAMYPTSLKGIKAFKMVDIFYKAMLSPLGIPPRSAIILSMYSVFLAAYGLCTERENE